MATFSLPGVYSLRLIADDGEYVVSSDATITVNVSGDFDGDFDVDQYDFARFQLCISVAWCRMMRTVARARFDLDADVDGSDFNLFVGCMSGANTPGDPTCTTP